MPRRTSLGTWLYMSGNALVLIFMSLRASTCRRARPTRPPRSAPAPHPGDAVRGTVPSHTWLADSLTPPSPPASHLRPPSPPLPRSPAAPRGERQATPAPLSMVARLSASSKPIAAGGAGARAATAAVRAATGKPAASSPPPSSGPTAPQPLQDPPNVPPCRFSSPNDEPRGQLRTVCQHPGEVHSHPKYCKLLQTIANYCTCMWLQRRYRGSGRRAIMREYLVGMHGCVCRRRGGPGGYRQQAHA